MERQRTDSGMGRAFSCFMLLAAMVALAASADPSGRVAILVVSLRTDAAGEAKAQAIMERTLELRDRAGYSEDQMGVLDYHFDCPDARRWCQQHLGVRAVNLPFVGVVTLDADGLPHHVLFRIESAGVADTPQVFSKACQAVGPVVGLTPPSPMAQVPVPTESPGHVTREIVNPKDGSVLVLVPAGPFTMGSNEAAVERPPHRVTLPAYYIGKNDITNAQYRRFVAETGYQGAGEGCFEWEYKARDWGEDAPVVNLSWNEAVAYCKWAGLRLPTEAEWEKAARGTDGRRYPWGNAWDPARAVWSMTGGPRPQPVGSKPEGASPYGCLDMAGNVWQYTSSWYQAYPHNNYYDENFGEKYHVVRGGAWTFSSAAKFRTTQRSVISPGLCTATIGFRCALTAPR